MSTVRDWIVVILLFCIAIRVAAWLIGAVIPLIASILILLYLVGLFINSRSQ